METMGYIFRGRPARGRKVRAQAGQQVQLVPGNRLRVNVRASGDLRSSPHLGSYFLEALPTALKTELSPLPAQETKSSALQNP